MPGKFDHRRTTVDGELPAVKSMLEEILHMWCTRGKITGNEASKSPSSPTDRTEPLRDRTSR
jgi:hypothetical protein